MAITVNGFGGAGVGGGQRGDYFIKVIDAPGSGLNGISNSANYTPATGNMQKLLDMPGPGRLLLLAPYSATTGSNKEVRIRVDADDRVIYKACKGKNLFNYSDSNGYYTIGDGLPKVIFTPGFFVDESINAASPNTVYPSTSFLLRKDKFFPGYTFGQHNDAYAIIRTENIIANYNQGIENCVDFHTREDDNRTGQLDYWRSAFLDGLFFDGNLTIRAAYTDAPSQYYKNGILVVYQLFDL